MLISWSIFALAIAAGCGNDDATGDDGGGGSGGGPGSGGSGASGTGASASGGGPGSGATGSGATGSGGGTAVVTPILLPDGLPPAGAGNDAVAVPAEGHPADSSAPTTVVGTGTPESCTSAAFVAAVLAGGVVTFDCGSEPVTIHLEETAKVHNLHTREVVIDGGGRVTLDGGSVHRILYQNACDGELGIDNERCDLQDYPRTTVQNLTFVNGLADDEEGGGAVFARGGAFKIVNCRFFHNEATTQGPDIGGGAVRITGVQTTPVYVVQSTFGGPGELGNAAANGGALSGLFTNYAIYNSVFENNTANGCCGNPATTPPGGGSGGAIYMDGLKLELSIYSSRLLDNSCRAHGSAIFFVSNDATDPVDPGGLLTIADSAFSNNAEGEGNWYPEPDISMHDVTARSITNTTFE